jgi:NitT/TauT family transport system substrate-binding protein
MSKFHNFFERENMTNKQFIHLAFGLMILFLIAACSSGTTTQLAEEPPAPIKIKVSRLPFLSFAPYFIADAEGYFDAQGLDIEFVQFERGADAIAALIAGEIDVWGGATSASIFNAMQRASLKIVGGRGYFPEDDCGYTAFLLRSELIESNRVQSAEDLAGLKVVQDREGGMRDYALRQLLEDAGLSLEDVQVVTIPDEVVIDAFEGEDIDLAAMGEPWVARIASAGHAESWLSFGQVLPDYPFGIIVFGERLLQEDEEAGMRFMDAFLQGIEQYNQGKTDRNLEILVDMTGLERALLEAACWPSYQADGGVDLQGLLDFQNWLMQNGYLDATLESEQLWDGRFTGVHNP